MTSDRVTTAPAQTVVTPVIAAGLGTTVTTKVAVHPAPVVYVIVEVPAGCATSGITTPVPVPTVATNGVLLPHVPSGGPAQDKKLPILMGFPVTTDIGLTLTVKVVDASSPQASVAVTVYVVVAVGETVTDGPVMPPGSQL